MFASLRRSLAGLPINQIKTRPVDIHLPQDIIDTYAKKSGFLSNINLRYCNDTHPKIHEFLNNLSEGEKIALYNYEDNDIVGKAICYHVANKIPEYEYPNSYRWINSREITQYLGKHTTENFIDCKRYSNMGTEKSVLVKFKNVRGFDLSPFHPFYNRYVIPPGISYEFESYDQEEKIITVRQSPQDT